MPKHAPAFMRDMLQTRNPPDQWKGVRLNSIDKAIIEQALSEMLERKHNCATTYSRVTSLIAKIRTLST